LAWSEGQQPLDAILHSSNELRELSQWFCHDDSTLNIDICIIVIVIIIITIIIIIDKKDTVTERTQPHKKHVSIILLTKIVEILRMHAAPHIFRSSKYIGQNIFHFFLYHSIALTFCS